MLNCLYDVADTFFSTSAEVLLFSIDWKYIYFVTYAGSIESNLMQMVMAKEKLNLFMKGQDADLDEIYDKFGADYNLLSILMR